MKIKIGDISKTLTFEVCGNFENVVVIKQYLNKDPHVLVVGEILKFRGGEDSAITITCLIVNYNTVISMLQDFITEKY